MSRISVIVITLNEARNIAACLQSVAWADEIIVVDAQSQDETVAIARTFTGNVFVEPWRGFSGQKNFALEKAQGEWVLWLDADERITPELAAEIRARLADTPEQSGFEMPRKAFFLGRWIKHCGWYPGHVLRLFRRAAGRFDDHQVHEGLILDGGIGRLVGDIEHYTDDSLEHYMWKFNRYTTLAAEELQARGRRAGIGAILVRPLHTFIKMYIFKRGFLDGSEGLILSLLSANYVAAKYAKTWESRQKRPGPSK